jgi:type VI secretion system protein ImpC
MARPFDFGGVNLTAGEDGAGARPTGETPFRIAIVGDFSGRTNRGISEPKTIGKRRAVLVDRDNFDEVLGHAGVEIELPMGEGSALNLRFSELEDFHPDRIFQRLDVFGKLRSLRARLADSASFSKAAEELGLGSGALAAGKVDTSPVVAPSAAKLASGSLLDDMIEQDVLRQTQARVATERPRRGTDEVGEFARRVVAQHLVSNPDPRQPEVLAVVDRAIGGLMRAVLHSPNFQALEAAWQAVFLLVRQLETGSQLKLYLIDISKAELAADLNSAKDLRETGTYRLLVEQSVETAGAEPWTLIVGNYSFGAGDEDAKLLSGMARIASRAGAAFLAGASPRLLGCDSLAATPQPRDWKADAASGEWDQLRRRAEAGSVGLALPRFLLRLPYGKKTSPLETFDFEEFSGAPLHEEYLWGNAVFAVALLLAQSFSEAGWEMRPGSAAQIEKLPLHVYVRDGESQVKPGAEVVLTEDAVERMVEQGLMPLVWFKGRDVARVVRFQSIAEPSRALAGRWNS